MDTETHPIMKKALIRQTKMIAIEGFTLSFVSNEKLSDFDGGGGGSGRGKDDDGRVSFWAAAFCKRSGRARTMRTNLSLITAWLSWQRKHRKESYVLGAFSFPRRISWRL